MDIGDVRGPVEVHRHRTARFARMNVEVDVGGERRRAHLGFAENARAVDRAGDRRGRHVDRLHAQRVGLRLERAGDRLSAFGFDREVPGRRNGRGRRRALERSQIDVARIHREVQGDAVTQEQRPRDVGHALADLGVPHGREERRSPVRLDVKIDVVEHGPDRPQGPDRRDHAHAVAPHVDRRSLGAREHRATDVRQVDVDDAEPGDLTLHARRAHLHFGHPHADLRRRRRGNAGSRRTRNERASERRNAPFVR